MDTGKYQKLDQLLQEIGKNIFQLWNILQIISESLILKTYLLKIHWLIGQAEGLGLKVISWELWPQSSSFQSGSKFEAEAAG